MKKSITPFTAQLVDFDTSLPFKDVIARLDLAVNKVGSAQFIPLFKAATNKSEIEALIKGITGDRNFLCVQYFNVLRLLLTSGNTTWQILLRNESQQMD